MSSAEQKKRAKCEAETLALYDEFKDVVRLREPFQGREEGGGPPCEEVKRALTEKIDDYLIAADNRETLSGVWAPRIALGVIVLLVGVGVLTFAYRQYQRYRSRV